MLALVTGATGFVGGHLVRSLITRGHAVRVLLRTTSRTNNIDGLPVERALGGLADIGILQDAMAGCDAVFHVAADYRLWARRPQDLYDTNVTGTRNVMEAAVRSGVAKVVYTSTVGALGIPAEGVGNEETPATLADLVGHYKRSKFMAEQAVREMCATGRLPVVIVHPSTPVGEQDIKPTPTGRIIVEFMNGRMPAYLQTGLNVVDVRDVAEGHVLAWERGAVGRRYILGNRNVTLQELLHRLAALSGEQEPAVQIPYWCARALAAVDTLVAGRLLGKEPRIQVDAVRMAAKHMYFSPARAVRELKLPQTDIDEALTRAIEWFRRNGYVGDAAHAKRHLGA